MTSELSGVELDLAVAKALGHKTSEGPDFIVYDWQRPGSLVRGNPFQPSTSWAQAGPIMAAHCISLYRNEYRDASGRFKGWCAYCPREVTEFGDGMQQYSRGFDGHAVGETQLIAAMRAFVKAKTTAAALYEQIMKDAPK